MKTFIKKAAILSILAFIALSCKDSGDDDFNPCTDIYAAITINVQYPDNSNLALDSYKVMWGDRDVTPIKDLESDEYKFAQLAGTYVIIDDAMQPEIKGKTITILVTGYIGDEEVLSEEFKVTADECHVNYTDAKSLVITIDRDKCIGAFQEIFIDVKHPDESPAAIDSYKVMWNNKDVTPINDFESENYKSAQESGKYLLVNDDLQPELAGKTVDLRMIGYINNEEVLSEEFTIFTDECHIEYTGSKPLEIVLGTSYTCFPDGVDYIPVQVRYGSQAVTDQPLDSYKVMWGGKDITPCKDFRGEKYKTFQKANSYPIITEELRSEIEGQTINVIFTGYIAGKIACTEEFKVSADENHIFYNDDKEPVIYIGYSWEEMNGCTSHHAYVYVEVLNADKTPVSLDRIKVMWGEKDITLPDDEAFMNKHDGHYAIISDAYFNLYGKIITVEFTGYIGEKEIVSEKFKVSYDGCHVFSPDFKPLLITIDR